MYRCLLAAVAAVAVAMPAAAQSMRNFPATALRGALVVTTPPDVTLNGHPARLGAGARIRGQDNLLKLSGTLVGNKLLVHYTVDPQGLLQDVWILTVDEAAKRPWPATSAEALSWAFDPIAQVWVKP